MKPHRKTPNLSALDRLFRGPYSKGYVGASNTRFAARTMRGWVFRGSDSGEGDRFGPRDYSGAWWSTHLLHAMRYSGKQGVIMLSRQVTPDKKLFFRGEDAGGAKEDLGQREAKDIVAIWSRRATDRNPRVTAWTRIWTNPAFVRVKASRRAKAHMRRSRKIK